MNQDKSPPHAPTSSDNPEEPVSCMTPTPATAKAFSASRRLPPLIALSYFEVAARTRSFAAAAKLLHVSPAAISHQIKALEAHLEVELFVRHHRKVVLTEAARAALPRLQEGFAAIVEAVEQMRTYGTDSAVITICAEPLFATKWLVPRLHRFYAHCPDAEVRLQASLSSVDSAPGGPLEAAAFQRSGIDLSVRLGFGHYPNLHTTPLLALNLVPVCAPGLIPRLDQPESVLSLPLLTDRTFLRSSEHLGWGEWLRRAGIPVTGPLKEQRFGNGLLALEAAVTGQGILLTSAALIEAELEAGKLVTAFDLPLETELAYHLVCPLTGIERPATLVFRDWLLAEITNTRPV